MAMMANMLVMKMAAIQEEGNREVLQKILQMLEDQVGPEQMQRSMDEFLQMKQLVVTPMKMGQKKERIILSRDHWGIGEGSG